MKAVNARIVNSSVDRIAAPLARLLAPVKSLVPIEPLAPLPQYGESLYGKALREDGLLPGTRVATQDGWTPVERLTVGDRVLTFDNGLQPITRVKRLSIARKKIPAFKAFTMTIPPGVLGNRQQLSLLPCQEVVVESDLAEAEYEEPFVIIQALWLDGYRGIHRKPLTADLDVRLLTFAAEQSIYVAGTALATCRLDADFSPLSAAAISGDAIYPRLTHAQLRRIADDLKKEATPGD